jgi:hypothetical protein
MPDLLKDACVKTPALTGWPGPPHRVKVVGACHELTAVICCCNAVIMHVPVCGRPVSPGCVSTRLACWAHTQQPSQHNPAAFTARLSTHQHGKSSTV